MPLFLDPVQTGSTGGRPSGNGLTIGLVNNMPDSACHATERQFLNLLRTASDNVPVRVRLFAISSVPRAEQMRRERFASLHDFTMIALLQVLEDAHRAFNNGGGENIFYEIGAAVFVPQPHRCIR